jgi:type I restriction enzyme S subunit
MELTHGYKQTEIGAIPEDWDVEPVGKAFDICNNLRLPISGATREKMAGPFPYYGPTSIQGYINEYRVEGEYALIGEDGDHFLKWRTHSMTQLVSGQFNVNNHAHLVQGSRNLTEWFYYYFSNRDLTPHLTRQGAGRYKLTKSALLKISCALPPTKVEQQAIAKALTDADAFVESLEQLLAKKRQIKLGAMQELLTGRKRLPGFIEKWKSKLFGEIAQPRKQRIDPRRTASNDFCIELEHIEQATGLLGGYTATDEGSSLKSVFQKDDVLFGKLRAYLRKYWLADREGVCSTEIWVLVANSALLVPPYLFQIVRTDRFIEAASTAYGTHMPRSDWNVVKNFELQVPPPEEQMAIAAVLSDMDAEITAFETKLAKARQLKQGMMQELLTGRIRIV